MSNPFDTPDTPTLVLQNDEQQHSLWPGFLPLPKGWTAVHGPAPRAECLSYVDSHWTDLRPASLRNAA
jgi:MbtH protein